MRKPLRHNGFTGLGVVNRCHRAPCCLVIPVTSALPWSRNRRTPDMPRIRFNDRAIRALDPPAKGQVDYFDSAGALPGFALRVTAKGVKAWTVLYRQGGRLRRLTLGRYPLVSLADARSKAREALAAVVQGGDPASEKTARREAPTFAEVAQEYIEREAKARNRSWREKERKLKTDVLPAWG